MVFPLPFSWGPCSVSFASLCPQAQPLSRSGEGVLSGALSAVVHSTVFKVRQMWLWMQTPPFIIAMGRVSLLFTLCPHVSNRVVVRDEELVECVQCLAR